MTDAARPRRPRCHRRLLVTAVLVIAAVGSGRQGRTESRPRLYVFLQTDAKVTVFEKSLRAKLPALEVTAFGRFRDFDDALVSSRPDAVMALTPVLVAKQVAPALRGLKNGRDYEEYVLVSVGAGLDGSLSDRLVGTIDVLGRAESHTWVTTLLSTPDVRTRFVTKFEDLLSLLQFGASEAILVPTGAVNILKERSRLDLHVRSLPKARVGRAAVAVLSPASRATVLQQIQGLDPETNAMIGVDAWREQ